MECSDAMMRRDNEKNVLLGPRLTKLPNNECIHQKGPYSGVKM